VDSDEPVIGKSEVTELEERVRELERILEDLTRENEILRDDLSRALTRKPIPRPILSPEDGSVADFQAFPKSSSVLRASPSRAHLNSNRRCRVAAYHFQICGCSADCSCRRIAAIHNRE